ncbi:TPA: hypothetical protein ACHIDG_004972 [Escherichia coli]|uniref:hypothetical protein n=1 Tax=Escherichia coli TaxID=562 RepID=UPI000DA45640|nr:hypothetical protein [Escherichia coli]EFI9105481.1 hypothetical protein [Escherichia coli]EHK0873846.1 hypothetical protein [Escherichia coli]EIE2962834.1 hypothetical protein [Escherichia coli]EIM8645893.1 hypothetical protein [Escherichia coli]EIQ0957466.1 hypothetical protein [Escherichia coli]
MADNQVVFKDTIFKDSSTAVNEYADEFAYSSFGTGSKRVGSIAFFKKVSDWVGPNEVQPVRYQIANIRMTESNLLELANFIISQHQNSKQFDSEE